MNKTKSNRTQAYGCIHFAMMIVLTFILAFLPTHGQAQTKVWNKIATGYVNVPIISITKVSIDKNRTVVSFRLDVPQHMTGDTIPLATQPTLRADGKPYVVKGATGISLNKPCIIQMARWTSRSSSSPSRQTHG